MKTKHDYRYYETRTKVDFFKSIYKVDTRAKKIYAYCYGDYKYNGWKKIRVHGTENYKFLIKNFEDNYTHLTEEEVFLKLL